MNRVLVIISSLLISINVLASDWPHENISNAEFAMEIKDRTPLNIIEELDNSFGKIYFSI